MVVIPPDDHVPQQETSPDHAIHDMYGRDLFGGKQLQQKRGLDVNHARGLVAIMSNGFRAWLEEMDGDVVELLDDTFNGSNAFRRTGVKAVMAAVQKPVWQVSDKADHSTSKAGHSTHPGHTADRKPQVAQNAPQASPAASNTQQKTTPETQWVSTSKTSVPTPPNENQAPEPPAESNAAKTNPSGPQQSPEQDKERHNEKTEGTGSDQDDRCLSLSSKPPTVQRKSSPCPRTTGIDACKRSWRGRELPSGKICSRRCAVPVRPGCPSGSRNMRFRIGSVIPCRFQSSTTCK